MLFFTRLLIVAALAIGCIGFVTTPGYTQDNKETAAQMVEIGDEIFHQTLAFTEARDLYITAVNMDHDNIRANYMAGVTTLYSVDKGAAKQYFLRVLELDPEYSFDILYKIGQAYHYDYQFDDAINYYSRYQQKIAGVTAPPKLEYATVDDVERKLYECEQGKILVEFPEEVEISNVGDEINSPSDDYAPVVSEDESILIFTSRRSDGNLNPDVASDNYPYEDIYIATKTNSVWGPAMNINKPVNTLYHDSNVGLAKDGSRLYIYKDDNNGDIFETTRDESGQWSVPKAIGKPVNTPYSETTVTLTPDGKTMFFASDRAGGFGGLDIWITSKNKRGEWDEPTNLGKEINTKYNEDGPFIGYDSKTLYFSSEGGEGMGGYDIYRVVYDSLSKTWDAPENMGYPINTPDDDIYFTPTKDGKYAFYSSVRDEGYGGSDIYMLKIPENLQHEEQAVTPRVTTTLTLKVFDEQKKPANATLDLKEIGGNGKLYGIWQATGVYNFVSMDTETKQFELSVSASGYESQKVTISIPAVGEASTILDKEIILIKKDEETVVNTTTSSSLRNIYFDFNRATLKAEYTDKIDNAVAYMKNQPSVKLLLVGHSDLVGAERYNSKLSATRAENVKKAIVAKGIAASRIRTKGEGSKYPLASNSDEKEGRELNRRVEFKIIQ